jgi:hypothetical protein
MDNCVLKFFQVNILEKRLEKEYLQSYLVSYLFYVAQLLQMDWQSGRARKEILLYVHRWFPLYIFHFHQCA